MERNRLLGSLLREEGAVAWGVSDALPVEESDWEIFQHWLSCGYHAGMDYMERYQEIRRDPRLLLEGARSVISMAFNYRQANPYKGVPTYALGQDYHKVLRRRLKRVVGGMKSEFGGEWRICIDSAPILERYWAVKCGVGTRSPVHGNVVVPGVGSMVFLAELVTTLQLPSFNENFTDYHSSDISLSIPAKVCPGNALLPGGMVDSRFCINYLAIEHQGELSEEQHRIIGDSRFGCDLCQRVCRENQGEPLALLPEFLPLAGLEEFLEGKDEVFDLSRSPLKRAVKNKSVKH